MGVRQMGFDFGLDKVETCFKRKFRWLLVIDGISADDGANALPPLKSARPNISFKEMTVKHLVEDIFYPARPEWKPITLVLYDLKTNENAVFEWIKTIYDSSAINDNWNPSGENEFKKEARLELYDGCGNVIERWIYENAWPQMVEYGDLDMGDSSYLTVEVTLRYDRARID